MAKVIEQFTDSRDGTRKYPWHEWTDGRVWRAVQGEDFAVSPATFRSSLTNRASKQGMKCTSRVNTREGTVEFQFIPKGDA
jgi:hypothetical protein